MHVVDRPPRGLILAPNRPDHAPVVAAAREALQRAGVEPIQLDAAIGPGGSFQDALARAVDEADFVIVDLAPSSGWSLFEAGYVLANRKPKLLLVHRQELGSDLPFDLFSYEVIFYALDNLDSLHSLIDPAVRSLVQRVTLAA